MERRECLFFQARGIHPTLQSNFQRRSRATCLPAATGRLECFPDLWSVTGKIVSTGDIKTWPQRHRFTAEEYNWMAEIGLLNGEPAVELIEGEIIHMAPMGTQHCNVVERLQAALQSALAGRALINKQRVFRLSNITEAQPDLIVLEPGRDYHSAKFPTGSDTLLVVEVSDTTFSYDHDIKVPLYAAHDVPEVWIVDLESRCVRFFRSLENGKYTDVQVVREPDLAKLSEFPDTNIDLSGLLI
jgi:Uma2 family endonuclease